MTTATVEAGPLEAHRPSWAYAAALAARWRLMDHPHLRLGARPMWSLLGYMLDENSEKYLLMITQERIDEMQSRLGTWRRTLVVC